MNERLSDRPSELARPAGLSNAQDDEVVVFQAVLLMPGGIGASVWRVGEYNEYHRCSHGEQVDLRDRYLPYAKLPPLVRAMLAKHATRLVDNLISDVRILNG